MIIEIKVRFRIWCRKSILNIGSLCILCRSSAKKPHGVITQKSAKRQSFSPQRNDRRANQPLNLEWFVQVLNTSSKNMLSSLVCVFSTWLKKKKKRIYLTSVYNSLHLYRSFLDTRSALHSMGGITSTTTSV